MNNIKVEAYYDSEKKSHYVKLTVILNSKDTYAMKTRLTPGEFEFLDMKTDIVGQKRWFPRHLRTIHDLLFSAIYEQIRYEVVPTEEITRRNKQEKSK